MGNAIVTMDIKYNEKMDLVEFIRLMTNIIDLGVSFSNPHIFLGTITNMDDEIIRAATLYLTKFRMMDEDEQVEVAKNILTELVSYFSRRCTLFKAIDLEPAMRLYRLIERFRKGFGSTLLSKIIKLYTHVDFPKTILPSVKENISSINELSEFCFSLIPVEVTDRMESPCLAKNLFFLSSTLEFYSIENDIISNFLDFDSSYYTFRTIYEILISKYYDRVYGDNYHDRNLSDFKDIDEDFLYKMVYELIKIFNKFSIEDQRFSVTFSGKSLGTDIVMFLRKLHKDHIEERLTPLVKKIILICYEGVDRDDEKMKGILRQYLWYDTNIFSDLKLADMVSDIPEIKKLLFDLKLEGLV